MIHPNKHTGVSNLSRVHARHKTAEAVCQIAVRTWPHGSEQRKALISHKQHQHPPGPLFVEYCEILALCTNDTHKLSRSCT